MILKCRVMAGEAYWIDVIIELFFAHELIESGMSKKGNVDGIVVIF